MRVLQAVGWYFPDSLGGTEVYVEALARRLDAEPGIEVTVAAPRPTDLPGADLSDNGSAAGLDRTRHGGLPVVRYPIPAAPSRAEAQGRRPARGSELFRRYLAEERFDLVHFHTFVTGLGLDEVAAARASGARVVVTTHSSALGFLCQRGDLMLFGERPCDGVLQLGRCTACALAQRGLPRPAARLAAAALAAMGATPLSRLAGRLPGRAGSLLGMRALIAWNRRRQRRLLELVDRFVLLTDWARDAVAANIERHFPDGGLTGKLAVNRLGHDLTGGDARGDASGAAVRKPGPDARPTAPPIRLGYLGRFEAIKGVDDLVAAVAALPAELPVTLDLAGAATSDDRDRLAALAGGAPRIRFTGPIAREAVAPFLAGLDLLCCPSRCAEGGPTVAIEAQAVGTPVVGSRIGGLAELIHDGVDGRLLPPGDRLVLTDALAAIAADPAATVDRWRRALPPGRSMDRVAEETLSLYRELVGPAAANAHSTAGGHPAAGRQR